MPRGPSFLIGRPGIGPRSTGCCHARNAAFRLSGDHVLSPDCIQFDSLTRRVGDSLNWPHGDRALARAVAASRPSMLPDDIAH